MRRWVGWPEHNDDDDDEGEGTGRDGRGGDQTARSMPGLHGEASVMEGDRTESALMIKTPPENER